MRVKVHHERTDEKHKPKRQGEFESIGVAKTPYHNEEKKSVEKRLIGRQAEAADLQVETSVNHE